jgi:Domain of unknown function (DUF3846)
MSAKDGEISILKIEPDGTVARIFIPNTLAALQHEVGGLIQYVPGPCLLGPGIVGICNEEGKNYGLPLNRAATELFPLLLANADFLVGPVLVATQEGDLPGDFPVCSLDLQANIVGPGNSVLTNGRRLHVGDGNGTYLEYRKEDHHA